MPVAMLSARVSALPFVRPLKLDGDDDSGGIFTLGGGGNVVFALLFGVGKSYGGDSALGLATSSGNGDDLRSRNGRRRAVISAGEP